MERFSFLTPKAYEKFGFLPNLEVYFFRNPVVYSYVVLTLPKLEKRPQRSTQYREDLQNRKSKIKRFAQNRFFSEPDIDQTHKADILFEQVEPQISNTIYKLSMLVSKVLHRAGQKVSKWPRNRFKGRMKLSGRDEEKKEYSLQYFDIKG